MVTSVVNSPVKELDAVDDTIAQQIDKAVEEAEQKAIETQKARLFYTMPMLGVRYYSFKGTKQN